MIPIKTRHMILLFLGALAIAMAIFWYNYSALGYSLSDLTTFFLAKDSRVQERLIMQPGTSTGVSIVAGTQTDTWLSNPDDLTLPRIELDGATGEWKFKHRGTDTTSKSFSDLTRAEADALYIAQNGGNGTNNTFINPTYLNGTQSGNTELTGNYIIGTETVAKHKVQYLSDVTDYIQAQINSKENSGNHVNIIRGSTGQLMEGQIDFILEGEIFGTSTYDVGTRRGTQTIGLNPMSSSRPNILEGGSVIGTQSTEINFEGTQFDIVANGSGVDINFSTTPQFLSVNLGTTTQGNGSIIEGTRNAVWGYTETEPYTYLSLHMDNPGTSTFSDSSSYNNAIIVGGNIIGTTTAKNGSGSAWFDGTGDYLSCADNDRWQWGTNTTVAAWVNMKTSGYAGVDRIALIGQAVDINNYWALTIYNNVAGASQGKPFFEFKSGGSAYASGYGTIAIAENNWTHVALVKSNTQYQIFVDGVSCATSTSATAMGNLAAALKIGTGTVSAIGQDLNGMVDDLVISGRNLWTTNFTPPPRTLDTINLADIAGDGSSGISVVIGTRTVQTGRTFEVMSGLTTLADSWDTRCDTKLKEVISEDPTLSEQVYNKLKLAEIKKWKFKNSDSEFVGIMIDDPNIPEEIIWRGEDGKIGGFSGTGFISFLYTATKRLIERVEQQQAEIDALKVIVNSK